MFPFATNTATSIAARAARALVLALGAALFVATVGVGATAAGALPSRHASAAAGRASPLFIADPAPVAASQPDPMLSPVVLAAAALGMLALGFCLALPTMAWSRRRRARQSILDVEWKPRARAPAEAPSTALRILPSNPFDSAGAVVPLHRQIEFAAQASVEFGRTLGIIFFRLGGPRDRSRRANAPWSEADVAALTARLRAAVRATDHVALINRNEIIVCISLLPGLSDLTKIAERLRAIGLATGAFGATFESPAGLSIYPICGYQGAQLIDFARVHYRNPKVRRRLAAPARAPSPEPDSSLPRLLRAPASAPSQLMSRGA